MLFDTSTNDKEVKRQINELVGTPFSLYDIIKFGAIGSSRMEVLTYSSTFGDVMNWDKQPVFASLSIRPKGLLVIINIRLSNYTWVVPYRYLSVFKTDKLSIHGNGAFLSFKTKKDQNKSFVNKVLAQKSKFLNIDYHGDSLR